MESRSEPAVQVAGAVVVSGGFPALAGLDLVLPAGSVTLMQGPNGAGKTTLLRLLAGLVPLESGRAVVLGHDLAIGTRAVRSLVGLVGPEPMLYGDLTIAENLDFWAKMGGIDTLDAAAATTMAILDRLEISDLADQPVATLSTGQRRRSALAVVVMRRPMLWLLDEPHAGLDQAGRDIVDRLIGDAIEAGATVIVASHEIDRVRPIATDVVTIAGGICHRHDRLDNRSGDGTHDPRDGHDTSDTHGTADTLDRVGNRGEPGDHRSESAGGRR